MTVGDIMHARFSVGPSAPSGAVCRALVAALLIPVLLAACDIFGPSEEVVLDLSETTWLSEPEPIDPVTHPPEPPPSDEVLIDSLFYRTELMVADTAFGSVPMSLTLRVRLRNPYDDPVTIHVPGCPTRPRVYETIDRGGPPIWNPQPSGGGFLGIHCAPGEFDVTVPPRDEITGGVVFVRPNLLARGLPDGRYYVTIEYHRVDKEPILLPAGSADIRFQEPGLEFHVSLEDTDEEVRLAIQVTNRNDLPMLLDWGGCSFDRLELYHDAARSNLANARGTGCADYGVVATVAPGETIRPDEFEREFDDADILDLLPSGTYYLSVRLLINQHDYHIPAGQIRLR